MTENQIAAQLLAKPIWQMTGEEFGSPAKLCVSLTHIILFVVSESEPENRKASGISSGGPTRHSLAACRPALSAGHGVKYSHRMHCTAYSRVFRFATYAATGNFMDYSPNSTYLLLKYPFW